MLDKNGTFEEDLYFAANSPKYVKSSFSGNELIFFVLRISYFFLVLFSSKCDEVTFCRVEISGGHLHYSHLSFSSLE